MAADTTTTTTSTTEGAAASEKKATEEEEDDNYIKTTTHNYISRKAIIDGPRQVALQGRSIIQESVKIRGDVGIVRIGRYVWIEHHTELEPPPLFNSRSSTTGAATEEETTATAKRVPMMIGNHTHIGPHCRIQAAAIGSMVFIGENVKIGNRCIIKDCCVIDANVTVGDDTVVPPFTRLYYDDGNNNSSSTTLSRTELPPSLSVELQEKAMDQYDAFTNDQRSR